MTLTKTQKMKRHFTVEIIETGKKEVGLVVSKKAANVLAFVSPKEKAEPKKFRRLVRIRQNIFRELEAMNKELKRHPEFEPVTKS